MLDILHIVSGNLKMCKPVNRDEITVGRKIFSGVRNEEKNFMDFEMF